MIRVILESPFANPEPHEHELNVAYARDAMYDSLSRGEAPMVSHLLYTQVLDELAIWCGTQCDGTHHNATCDAAYLALTLAEGALPWTCDICGAPGLKAVGPEGYCPTHWAVRQPSLAGRRPHRGPTCTS